MEDKNFILELIEEYRSLPALWNVNAKEYNDRILKRIQYEKLLIKYREKYPKATKRDLTQKINNLRTNYRRELKRMSKLESSGMYLLSEMDSSLYYYHAMRFLREIKQPNSTLLNNTDDSSREAKMHRREKRKRKRKDPNDELLAMAAKRLMQPQDDSRKLCEAWALKLQKMDETQRLFAEKFINEIIFEGQMGTLHRNAMQLNCHPSARNTTNGNHGNAECILHQMSNRSPSPQAINNADGRNSSLLDSFQDIKPDVDFTEDHNSTDNIEYQ